MNVENEMVPVDEDLPQLECGCKNVSRNCYLQLSEGGVIEGYYNYRNNRWYNVNSKPIKQKVIAWCDL